MTKLTIISGDITQLRVDAIVNAANSTLLGGGGVDGSIHAAAGPELLAECKKLNGCSTGEAKLTRGYKLPAKYIIHTVGPIYGSENGKEQVLLENCYRNSLDLAIKNNCNSIAFPSISTGAYGYPITDAVKIVNKVISEYLTKDSPLAEIILVLHSSGDLAIYNKSFYGNTHHQLSN